jgi:uncharacterized protein with HEPN domain
VKKLLFDVITACRDIEQSTAGKTLGDYLGSELLRSAVERKFGIIGERSRSTHPLDRSARISKGENTYSSDPGFSALLVRRL